MSTQVNGGYGMSVLRSAAAAEWRLVGGASLAIMVWQASEALVPVMIGVAIDRAVLPGDGLAMAAVTLALCGLFAVLSWSFRIGARWSVRAREVTANRTRVDLARKELDSRTVHGSRPTGTTVSILGDDADRVGAYLATIPFACGAVASVAVTAALLVGISPVLGLLVLVGAPLLVFAVHRLGAPLERRAGAEQALAANAASVATDLISGLRVLKGIGGEAAAGRGYVGASRQSLHATLATAKAEALYDALAVVLTLSYLAVIVLVGAKPAMEGRISVGELVAAVGLAVFLIGPLTRLTDTGAALARARASAARVESILEGPTRAQGAWQLPMDLRGELRVDGPELGFSVAPGQIVGVVADPGDSAAVLRTLTGHGCPGSTSVTIDGIDICDLDSDSRRRALVIARHHESLFSESLWDNVAAGGADEASVLDALVAADADQVAATLPDGLNSMLAEGGSSLSGGQRQRVALARALAANPAVLVLHDPTTALDSATGIRIAEGLRRMRDGRTTLILTTDPSLLASCDRVLFVRGGSLRTAGQHADLRESEPAYRDLVLA